MDLNETLIFVKVVGAGSFTAAARDLHLPKSTVSRKVAELEARLGARLLQRTTRRLSLTDVGRTFHAHAARAVAEVEAAEQAVTALEQAPRGLLRVTAPLDLPFVGPICAEYLRRHPGVQLELTCTDRVVDLVEEGFDVAVRAGRLADSRLIARKIASWERVLVAAPAYLERRGEPRKPAELAEHDCLVFTGGHKRGVWELQSGRKSVEVPVRGRLVSNDIPAIEDALRAGLGVALLPRFRCAGDLRDERLRHVLAEWCSTTVPLHAVYPSSRHLSPKVKAFLDLAKEQLLRAPWSALPDDVAAPVHGARRV